MAFKLKNIFKQLKKGQQERGMFSEKGKAERKEMRKTGESKFQYDVRKSRERSKLAKTQQTKTSPPEIPDHKSKINIEGGNPPSWEWKTQERNPGDLREQWSWSISSLPSEPGDPFEYDFDEKGNISYRDTRKGRDADWEFPEKGSTEDKAIRERYTGSETGDLSSWHGHDTRTSYSSYDVDPVSGEMIDESFRHEGWDTKESYLPYDLAQKHYNPKYKGSKK